MNTLKESPNITIENLEQENRWLKWLLRLVILGIEHDVFRYSDKKEQDKYCAAVMEHAM